jgi:3-phosphoshikimate 1-carboxyvinyltransferase
MNWKVQGATRPLVGEARVPGDKSIGHRAVLFAGIAEGRSRVTGLSGGEDNRRTVAALAALGVELRELGPGTLEVVGRGLDGLRAPAEPLDCGNSGTSMRLLCGLLAPRRFSSTLVGDRYLMARPMRRVAEPLGQMGARLEGQPGKKPGEIYPPLTVGGTDGAVRGINYLMPVSSAQVKSAVLLAALVAEGATTVVERTPSRDHTERMLAHMGAPITALGGRVTLDPDGWRRRLAARDLEVPGDLSSSAFLLAAATVVPGSRVVVRGVGVNPTRTGFLDALQAMGGQVEMGPARTVGGEPVADLACTAAPLRGTEIGGALAVRAIDELPLLAALAAHAEGTTVVRDAAELRVKESDRVASTAAMLRALGVAVEEQPDGWVIQGGGVRPGAFDSHGDHRIAMAGAVCALGAAGETAVGDVDNVATSFPGFAETLRKLGAEIG